MPMACLLYTSRAAQLSTALAAVGVLVNPTASQRLRAVTHYPITAVDIERTVAAVGEALLTEFSRSAP